MKNIALLAIRFYQRTLSPHKGFRCAYAAYTGCASCSELGYRAIRRLGLWHGLRVLDRRLDKCGVAYRRYRPRALAGQAGFLDCGACDVGSCDVGSCDVGPCDVGSASSDIASNACSCTPADCNWRTRTRSRGADKYVVIRPRKKAKDKV